MADDKPNFADELARQQREATARMKALAKIFPGAFNEDGSPIVATLRFPEATHG